MPTQYNPLTFEPLGEIRIIFSPERLQDNMATGKGFKELYTDKIEKVLLSGEPNVPYERNIILRLSSRSIKYKERV